MMRGPVYVAQLHPDDYDRFRERDPSLPALYPQWLKGFTARVDALRRRGVTVIRRPIDFADFAATCAILGVSSLNDAARDDYAASQAAAEAIS